MASVVAADPVLDALFSTTRAVLAGLTFASGSGSVSVPVYEGAAEQRTEKPYVIVGGGTSETPFNTLGPPTGPKFGADVSVPIRVVAQYPTTERQLQKIFAPIKAALDGQKVDVSGFGRVLVTCGFAQVLTDTLNGVLVRELVAPFDVTVHQ